jgi:Holliday junction DNA helicase RuvA
MIGYLEGTVVHTSPTYIIVSVGGVGYKVFAVPSLLGTPVGQPIKLFTYHKSSDDGQALFGLPTASSLDFFELLLTVSGVGPKIALSILSAGDIEVLQRAIAGQDTAFFSQMSGVGKKTAERIIVELKDKMGTLPGGLGVSGGNGGSEIFNALSGLGYGPYEIRNIMGELNASLSTEEQLKQALKLLSAR